MNARTASAALAGLCLLASGCGRADGSELATRDLSMLELMVQLNAVHLGMEPYLRSVEHLEDLAGAAEGIAAIANDPLMLEWPTREDFGHAPERWRVFREQLSASSEDAAAAARAGDLDGLHAAYTIMDATCIGCHKRYQPTY